MNDMVLTADSADFNGDTGDAYAQGHVHYVNFTTGEKLDCDRAEYNVDTETGTFYNVRGTSPAKINSSPGVLSTTNPFYFQGEWARRLQQKYVIYRGFVTDCTMPRPWWRLTGPKFDIIPGERAKGYRSVFRVRRLPLFYAPVFYKDLRRNPRQSGFLSPSIGHSTLLGYMIGIGYYWAINPSYDLLYEVRDYSIRGFAHTAGFRGKVRPGTDFDLGLYGLNDRGIPQPNGTRIKEGGFYLTGKGRAELGGGWEARGNLDYLSSFVFRQNFTMTFTEAVFSESHTNGVVTKHWSDYAVNFVGERVQNYDFDPYKPDKSVITRKLPEADFLVRDKQITQTVPLWFSLDSSAGLLDREQPAFSNPLGLNTPALQTPLFMPRLDLYPHLTTALHLAGFSLVPTFSVRETQYGDTQRNGVGQSAGLLRSAREFTLDLIPPSLARVFNGPKFLGPRVKHVIEPRITYHWVDGIGTEAQNLIRFDSTELMTNTNELRVSLTNRLYVKHKKDDGVDEALSWQLTQIRYFDPTFGGALVPGQRNVILSTMELTGFDFLSGPRSYSPVDSILRFEKGVGVQWRTDYDPMRPGIVMSELTADYRFSKYWINLGQATVREDPVTMPVPILSPSSNQLRGTFAIGNQNRRGWNAGTTWYYDYKRGILAYSLSQVTWNTDCCGFSGEFRRFDFGTRFENQYLFSFSIANVGSVGNLRRQERVF